MTEDIVRRIKTGWEDEFAKVRHAMAKASPGITVMWDDQLDDPAFYIEVTWATVGDPSDDYVIVPRCAIAMGLDSFREFVSMATSMLISAETGEL